jgi:hypothetical protein
LTRQELCKALTTSCGCHVIVHRLIVINAEYSVNYALPAAPDPLERASVEPATKSYGPGDGK